MLRKELLSGGGKPGINTLRKTLVASDTLPMPIGHVKGQPFYLRFIKENHPIKKTKW
jgi:hypothetical protein